MRGCRDERTDRGAARRAHARREGGDGRRGRPLAHGRGAEARHPRAEGHRRSRGCAGRAMDGPRRGVVPVRHRARRDLEPGARAHGRRAHRRRGAAQGRARAARADGQHPPASARGPQLRVLLRGPVPLRAPGRRVHQRRAVDRCRLLREALRRERLRVRAHDDQLGARRADVARDLARAVRGRGARSARVVGDGGVQPRARHVLQRAPAARRSPAPGVGIRRRDHVGLVRHAQHRARGERGARPRDAGPGAVVRREPRGRGAGRRRERSRASTRRSGGC